MWSALIADDEALSRYAFRTFLAKGDYPIDPLLEASDGDEAVAMALTHTPDLIFLDIRMPGMNGIEAAAAILAALPDTLIVMLTAYDHFSYVQKAIDIGVRGYLLKPFQKEELAAKIEALVEELSSSAERVGPKELDLLRDHAAADLLDLLLFPSSSGEQESALLVFLGWKPIISGTLMLAEMPFPTPRRQQILCRTVSAGADYLAGRGYGASLIALFPAITIEMIGARLEQFRSGPGLAGFTVLRTVLIPFRSRSSIPRTFQVALSSMDRVPGGETVLLPFLEACLEAPTAAVECAEYPYEVQDRLEAAIEQVRLAEAGGHLQALCRYLEAGSLVEMEAIEHLAELTVLIRTKARRAGYVFEDYPGSAPLRNLTAFRTIPEGIRRLQDLFRQYSSSVENREEDLPVWKLSRAFLYVRRNLFGDLGLEQVADEVGLSPQYLSKRFKEAYGKSFTDYMTQERISRARFLLGTTDQPVKTIGISVGYADPNYFSRVFKKGTGLTPQQYRDHVASLTIGSSS